MEARKNSGYKGLKNPQMDLLIWVNQKKLTEDFNFKLPLTKKERKRLKRVQNEDVNIRR